MRISKTIRLVHRWISILFTLTVISAFAVPAIRPDNDWVYYLPLAPLAVLLMSGLYMFALPYFGRGARQG